MTGRLDFVALQPLCLAGDATYTSGDLSQYCGQHEVAVCVILSSLIERCSFTHGQYSNLPFRLFVCFGFCVRIFPRADAGLSGGSKIDGNLMLSIPSRC
jgi:hypothetical protein